LIAEGSYSTTAVSVVRLTEADLTPGRRVIIRSEPEEQAAQCIPVILKVFVAISTNPSDSNAHKYNYSNVILYE
jgi:hypothetical protein